MWNSDELFRLVKSLTKSEKRYFKLFTRLQNGNKKYVVLFDAIDAQGEYDERELKEQFREEKFVRQFNVAKHYLSNLILKSLRLYHSEANVRQELKEWLRNAEILRDKGLHSQAQAMLTKVLENSAVTGNYLSQIEALDRIHREAPEMCSTEEGVEHLFARKLQVVDQLRNTLEYSHLYYRLLLPVHYDFPRSREQKEEMGAVMADPLLESEESALSLTATVLYNSIHLMYYYTVGENRESCRYATRLCVLHEENPNYLKERPFIYLAGLDYLLRSVASIGDTVALHDGIERLEKAGKRLGESNKIKADRVRELVREICSRNMMTSCIVRGEYDECHDLIPEIEECILGSTNNYHASHGPWASHAISCVYFAQGKYRAALDYNNSLAAEREPEYHHLIYLVAKVLNIIIHYELGNVDLVEQLVRSVRKFIASLSGEFLVEKRVLEMLEDLIETPDRSRRHDLMMNTYRRLLELYDTPLEKAAFCYFDYTIWLESRLYHRSFVDVATEKYRRKTRMHAA